ncbi:JmjC domain-containing protein [Bdellovibrio sp. HCB290]|uniref:JmjC domain-containing protein n=1 Tax=Bdellovibrio sp. HCB290 TaxID=3394356 RepID=UPI0039B44B8A
MASPAQLDQKFWTGFARNIWEKKPLALKNVQSSLREISADEIFKLLVLFADRCRKLNDSEGFKFYIDGFKADPEEVLQVLPEKSDKSLLGYHERMKALFPDYCLVCDELLQVNLSKQHLLTDFTDQLYQHVGFPNRFSEMGLYLGNYRKTPFGVHVDSCGVFSFPVVGKKKFRLWSPEYVKKNPSLDRAFSYEKHKKHSELLEAGPGDITYWPSSAWHIAESDGSFSATWSLGVWVDKSHKEMVTETLKSLLDSHSETLSSMGTTRFKTRHNQSGEVTELPPAYQQSIEMLQKMTQQELQETFLKSWMKHISSQGFKTIPHTTLKLTAKSHISLRSTKSPILWQQSQISKSKVYFSFGGALIEGTKGSSLHKLILSLNAGKSCQVDKKDLQVLQLLADAGAFSRGEVIL